eukprot:GEMP01029437.1.p1 GENE.GEMP01029437.1~~GEMP01029437.1.p1  ORF type:complete len:362 (+),score=93.87 GEMP01029437.1:144-1229(+)
MSDDLDPAAYIEVLERKLHEQSNTIGRFFVIRDCLDRMYGELRDVLIQKEYQTQQAEARSEELEKEDRDDKGSVETKEDDHTAVKHKHSKGKNSDGTEYQNVAHGEYLSDVPFGGAVGSDIPLSTATASSPSHSLKLPRSEPLQRPRSGSDGGIIPSPVKNLQTSYDIRKASSSNQHNLADVDLEGCDSPLRRSAPSALSACVNIPDPEVEGIDSPVRRASPQTVVAEACSFEPAQQPKIVLHQVEYVGREKSPQMEVAHLAEQAHFSHMRAVSEASGAQPSSNVFTGRSISPTEPNGMLVGRSMSPVDVGSWRAAQVTTVTAGQVPATAAQSTAKATGRREWKTLPNLNVRGLNYFPSSS